MVAVPVRCCCACHLLLHAKSDDDRRQFNILLPVSLLGILPVRKSKQQPPLTKFHLLQPCCFHLYNPTTYHI